MIAAGAGASRAAGRLEVSRTLRPRCPPGYSRSTRAAVERLFRARGALGVRARSSAELTFSAIALDRSRRVQLARRRTRRIRRLQRRTPR